MRGKRLQLANQRAEKTFQHYHGDRFQRWTEEWKKHTLGIYRKTQSFCRRGRCLCTNPRRFSGETRLTRQELKANDDFNQQINDE